MLAKMWNRCVGANDLLLFPTTGYGQALKTVLDSIAIERDVLTRLGLLIVPDEIGEAVREQLLYEHLGLRIPQLIGLSERRESFDGILGLVAELLLDRLFEFSREALPLKRHMQLLTPLYE